MLIELLVVISILALLIALLLFSTRTDKRGDRLIEASEVWSTFREAARHDGDKIVSCPKTGPAGSANSKTTRARVMRLQSSRSETVRNSLRNASGTPVPSSSARRTSDQALS